MHQINIKKILGSSISCSLLLLEENTMTKFELTLNTLSTEAKINMVKEIVSANEDKFATLLHVLDQDMIVAIVENAIMSEGAEGLSELTASPAAAMDSTVSTLEAEIAMLQSEVSAHLNTIKVQKEELDAQSDAYQAMAEEYNTLSLNHASLQDELKAAEASLSTAKEQVVELQNQIADLEKAHSVALAEKDAELNKAQADYSKLLEELASLNSSDAVEENLQEEIEEEDSEEDVDFDDWFEEEESAPVTTYSYRTKESSESIIVNAEEESQAPEQVGKTKEAEIPASVEPAKKMSKLASLKKASINDFNAESMVANTPQIDVSGSFKVRLETLKYGYGCPLASLCQKVNKEKHNSQTKIVEKPCVEKGCSFICGEIQDNLKAFVGSGSYAYAYEGKEGRLYVHGNLNGKKVDLGILNFNNTVEGRKIEDIVRASVKQRKGFQIEEIVSEDKVVAVSREGRVVNEVISKTPDIFTKVVISF